MKTPNLRGIIAATHTPFGADAALNLAAVETQAAHFSARAVGTVFIGGSTGESHSLTLEERRQLTQRWMEISQVGGIKVIVHVGSNCLSDAVELARQAGQFNATAIAMVAPSYFKPRSPEILVECCKSVAQAAPETPFYYYDIPPLTGLKFSMPQFMEMAAAQIPNFAGLKFSNPDLMEFQLCQRACNGERDVFWGCDEYLLSALALGARGGIGSTYNFAPQLGQGVMTAFENKDFEAARKAQFRIVQWVQLLTSYSYLPAAKAVMTMLGVPVGPARLPHDNLSAEQLKSLRADLEKLGFFEWTQEPRA